MAKPATVTAEMRRVIAERFVAGETLADIGAVVGLSPSTVAGVAKRAGLKRKKPKSRSPWHKK